MVTHSLRPDGTEPDINRYGMVLPPPRMSWADVVSRLPKERKDALLAELGEDELAEWARNGWLFVARREQLPPPGDWRVWLSVAGRGAGKTRGMLELLWRWHQYYGKRNTGLGGRTESDVLKTLVHPLVTEIAPHDFRPRHIKTDGLIVWPNDTYTWLYTGDSKEGGRGGNLDGLILDELAAWHDGRSDDIAETWHNISNAVRVGSAEIVIGTTWRRGVPALNELAADQGTVVTTMDTLDNAQNLPQQFVGWVKRSIRHSWGEQEFLGRIPTEDETGMWWTPEILNECVTERLDRYERIIVAVDPSVTGTRRADETGIIVLGLAGPERVDVLDDRSVGGGPDMWVPRVIGAYDDWGADCVVAEANQGGDLVERVIVEQAPNVRVTLVKASKSKAARAEPVVRLYTHGFVKHAGRFEVLESQMLSFSENTKKSPDRVDALVWGITELMLKKRKRAAVWDIRPGSERFARRAGMVAAIGGS